MHINIVYPPPPPPHSDTEALAHEDTYVGVPVKGPADTTVRS